MASLEFFSTNPNLGRSVNIFWIDAFRQISQPPHAQIILYIIRGQLEEMLFERNTLKGLVLKGFKMPNKDLQHLHITPLEHIPSLTFTEIV